MEAVEDLMVCKACHTHRSIGETSVNGFVYRSEGDVITSLLKDGLQTLGLLGAISEDIELVATSD